MSSSSARYDWVINVRIYVILIMATVQVLPLLLPNMLVLASRVDYKDETEEEEGCKV
jgi:hypothetical protein